MAQVIIEVFNAHGLRQDYRTFRLTEIRIGRAYDNDLNIADPYVSPYHLLLRTEGDAWIVEDLDSENGLLINKSKKPVKQAVIQSGDECVIGRTHLRIMSSNHAVPPAKSLNQSFSVNRVSHPLMAWGLAFLMFILYAMEAHMSTSENLSFDKLATVSVLLVVTVIIWAGIWAFVGRLIRHKAHFSAQLSVSVLFWILSVPMDYVTSYIGYYTNNLFLENILVALGVGVLFIVALVRNLSIATNISQKNKMIGASSITFVIIALVFLSYASFQDQFNQKPKFYASLKPPIVNRFPSQTIDGFLDQSEDIFLVEDK